MNNHNNNIGNNNNNSHDEGDNMVGIEGGFIKSMTLSSDAMVKQPARQKDWTSRHHSGIQRQSVELPKINQNLQRPQQLVKLPRLKLLNRVKNLLNEEEHPAQREVHGEQIIVETMRNRMDEDDEDDYYPSQSSLFEHEDDHHLAAFDADRQSMRDSGTIDVRATMSKRRRSDVESLYSRASSPRYESSSSLHDVRHWPGSSGGGESEQQRRIAKRRRFTRTSKLRESEMMESPDLNSKQFPDQQY
ncbi:hypothetical protein MIR68_010568 [Amoeboaphelidium protococcarum]|nr:hypothetical protein MIR68_010568 [Amoeboaphelidium protococcarum]